MANEKTICCCGASTWTKVIAWFQIVSNVLLIITYTIGVVGLAAYDTDQIDMTDSTIAAIAILFAMSILGLIMGIFLLKGTKQKRVAYLRAWLIYGCASVLTSIVSLIINIVNLTDSFSVSTTFVTSILGIFIDVFCVAVVYIHMKEINDGVFTQKELYT